MNFGDVEGLLNERLRLVEEFHRAFGHPHHSDQPDEHSGELAKLFPHDDVSNDYYNLRVSLNAEELKETDDALAKLAENPDDTNNFFELVDGFLDLQYVTSGFLHTINYKDLITHAESRYNIGFVVFALYEMQMQLADYIAYYQRTRSDVEALLSEQNSSSDGEKNQQRLFELLTLLSYIKGLIFVNLYTIDHYAQAGLEKLLRTALPRPILPEEMCALTSALFAEVHNSNMSKLGEDGKPLHREDNKVMKGPNYRPPNLAKIVREFIIKTNKEEYVTDDGRADESRD